jgi:hypothetical protein
MHPFKKMIFSISLSQTVVATPTTELALRSNTGYLTTTERNICLEQLIDNCKIATQVANEITSGDRMYEADGITPFNGGSSVGGFQAYYNVDLSIRSEASVTRVCLINNDGFIEVDTICNI